MMEISKQKIASLDCTYSKVNAEILQLDDKIGTLEVGKLADIAAWKRDLLTDPKALLDCAFVMKEGIVYQTECTEGLED